MSRQNDRVVIVGAGHAGGSVAALLRQFGWTGPIVLIGEEPVPPYQRPPLSKTWLKDETPLASIALRPVAFYADNGITLRLATSAMGIDRAAGRVVLPDGTIEPYDWLVLATGARPRRLELPGADLAGVLELRTVADAGRLKAALGHGRRLAVIGGGYIGLEIAASAQALGAEAVVIEREERLMMRTASPEIAAFFAAQHRTRGVGLHLGAQIEAIEGTAQVSGVRLSDGQLIAAETVLVGVGAAPDDALARAAGLNCNDGIIVDASARTSDPAIYAIGDCTRRPLPLYQATGRLESVPNALEQAKQAAATICGRPLPAPEVPWFWSDQYDLRLQIAGLPLGAVQVVLRGRPDAAPLAAFHLDADGRILAVEAVNAAPEFMAGRALIGRRARVARERLADTAVSMKDVIA